MREGQRVVCRDGRLATIVNVEAKGEKEYRVADLLIDGMKRPFKAALWVCNGKGNRYPDRTPGLLDAMTDAED